MKSIQIVYNMEFCREIIFSIYGECLSVDYYLVKEKPKDKTRMLIKAENVQKYQDAKQKIKNLYELLIDLRKKFINDSQFRKGLATDCAIIQFKSQKIAKLIVEYFGSEKVGMIKQIKTSIKKCLKIVDNNLLFKGEQLKIVRAPQPSDMLW